MQSQLLPARIAEGSFHGARPVERGLQSRVDKQEGEDADFLSTMIPLLGLATLALVALIAAVMTVAVWSFGAQ